MTIAKHAGGRATPNFRERINGICVITRPIPASPPAVESPAMMAGLRDMIKTRRCVPRQKKIAFHIAVVGEEVAKSVEVEIVRISKAVRDGLDPREVGGNPQQCAAFDGSNRRHWRGDMLRAEAGIVSANQVEP